MCLFNFLPYLLYVQQWKDGKTSFWPGSGDKYILWYSTWCPESHEPMGVKSTENLCLLEYCGISQLKCIIS